MSCSLGAKIRIVRIIRGYNQKRMASLLNLSQQDYSHLEYRGKRINDVQFAKICEVLNVDSNFMKQLNMEASLQQRVDEYKENNSSFIKLTDAMDIIHVQKAMEECLHENIYGLRHQIKEQNKTIKILRKLIQTKKEKEG